MMSDKTRDKAPKCDDVFCMVNGKPSNSEICEQMLEGEQPSPEVTAYLITLAKSMGFSEEEAQLFWG
jgi:hypothetical protein